MTKVIVVALLIITFLSFRVSSEPLFEVSATSQTESNPIGLAFDGSRVGNSFWEALGGYPFSVEWTYPTATKISSYSLSSGEYELKRMPTSWTLEGSGDGKEWLVVDQRESIADWQLSETRTFHIKDPRALKAYRLIFTSGAEKGSKVIRVYEIVAPKTSSVAASSAIVTGGQSSTGQFTIHDGGVLEWPGALRVSKSVASDGLPPFDDGQTRAQPGGSLVVQPLGDIMRGAIDLLPTSGQAPDTGAHSEVTLHRRVPDKDGYDMVSFAALARDDLPFGILLERRGRGKSRPFIFMNFLENLEFTKARFQEPLRITEDGTVQIGRKRGVGSTARLLNNDPTQVDALFMEREDPLEPGSYNSDFFKITAKSRQGTIIKRHDWRLNVQLGKQGSSLVVGFAQNEAESEARISFHENGAVELLGPGAGLILRSPGGGRWHLTVDDRGQLTTETRP